MFQTQSQDNLSAIVRQGYFNLHGGKGMEDCEKGLVMAQEATQFNPKRVLDLRVQGFLIEYA